MALQLRRGLDAARSAITPVEGELLYTTDTKKVYIGDGTTAGGNAVGGGTTTNALTIGTGLSGTTTTFNGSAANTITLATTGVAAGTYGNYSYTGGVPSLTVDSYGRITSITENAASGGNSFSNIYPSAGGTTSSPSSGGTSLTASSSSDSLYLFAGSNITMTATSTPYKTITISSTSASTGPTWTSNTTMGGSMTVTSPTGYSTSGSRLVVVIVGTMSGTTSNFTLTSGTASWSSHSSSSYTFVYSTPTSTSVGSSITITPSAYSNYAMAYAYIQTSATSTYTSMGTGSGTSGSVSNPTGGGNPRIIGVSNNSSLNLSTVYSTVTGGGPTWSGSGAVHGSTTGLSVAVWTGTGSWTTSATPTLTSNPGLYSWNVTGIAS
jgi:hypothetical protein